MAYSWVSQGISTSGVEDQISLQVQQLSQSVLQTQSPPFS